MKRTSKGWLTVTIRLAIDQKEAILKYLDRGHNRGLSTFMRKVALKEIGYEKIG